ncbi:hypothetical protein BZA77DRAFT_294238 [Pyronema omphalodes]|nr:hypothetical protein BZA77DRAFT_294238 [Pyronema omphalodes]
MVEFLTQINRRMSNEHLFEPTQCQNRGIQALGLLHDSTVDADAEDFGVTEELVEIENQVYGSYDYLCRCSWKTSNIMTVSYFLNPVEEEVHDSLEHIEDHIIATYQEVPAVESDQEEIDEAQQTPVEKVHLRNADRGFERFVVWDNQRDVLIRDPKPFECIEYIRKEIRTTHLTAISNMHQTRLEDYVGSR